MTLLYSQVSVNAFQNKNQKLALISSLHNCRESSVVLLYGKNLRKLDGSSSMFSSTPTTVPPFMDESTYERVHILFPPYALDYVLLTQLYFQHLTGDL